MAHGRDFQRAIDRLTADLTRIAERVIAIEVERAIAQATARMDRRPRPPKAAARPAKSVPSGPSRSELAAQRRAEREQAREAERKEREEARERRRQEREQLRQELLAAREATRQERDRDRHDKVSARAAKQKAREAEEAARLSPPPLVVFKRSRDGQVTVLQPRPVETENGVPAAVQPTA